MNNLGVLETTEWEPYFEIDSASPAMNLTARHCFTALCLLFVGTNSDCDIINAL